MKGELAASIERALLWLGCQEHQVWRLLQQNEASDWADIMPRSGFVLYTNVLWFWVKRLYDLPTALHTRDYANHLFFPFGNAVSGHRRMRLLVHYIRNRVKRSDYYLSFVNFSLWGEELDVFGNILAALTGMADSSRAGKIASSLLSLGVCHPHPVRVVGIPILPNHPLWRLYMQRHRQNLPWQYHNGGSWPFVGGFWILLLARLGMVQEASRQLESLARDQPAQRLGIQRVVPWPDRQAYGDGRPVVECRPLHPGKEGAGRRHQVHPLTPLLFPRQLSFAASADLPSSQFRVYHSPGR